MLECSDKLRCDPPDNYTYHDRLFANKMNYLIQLTGTNYEDTMYREALKTGFYAMRVRWIGKHIAVCLCSTNLLCEKVSCNLNE